MKTKTKMSLAAVSLLGLGAIAFAAGNARWSLNGQTVSGDVRMIGGKPYVALSDVAKAMKMSVVKNGSSYDVRVAGGATQVNGIRQGKIGDQLSSGDWGLLVTGVREVTEYNERYSQEGRQVMPKNDNEKLIVVDAVIRNNVQRTQTPVLTERYCDNTALADDQGMSYPPIDIDARQESSKIGSYGAAALLPAAKMKMALVFSVPKDTVVKALVFSCLAYPDNIGKKGVDLRISLK